MDRVTRLLEMVAKANQMFPGLVYKEGGRNAKGSRAAAAMDIVLAGGVRFVADLPVSGIDEWAVGEHRCSYRSGQCSCQDRKAPQDGRLGKLCKHRLAVMFVKKLNSSTLEPLRRVLAQAELGVTLVVDRYYNDDGPDQYRVKGWHGVDVERVELAYGDRVQVGESDMFRFLEEAGYRIEDQRKGMGFEYRYRLARFEDALTVGGRVGLMKVADAAYVEERFYSQKLQGVYNV